MKLEEQLRQKKEALKAGADAERQRAEEERLAPARERIQKLEKDKDALLRIRNSLVLRSDKTGDETIGVGMTEYSDTTKQELESAAGRLDRIVAQHGDFLKEMGIQNRKDLLKHANTFKEGDEDSEEVAAYKKAEAQDLVLQDSDEALRARLKEFGVEVSDEGFSYDVAEKAVTEKVASLEQALLQEKLQTPEGRQEVIAELAEEIRNKITTVTVQDEFRKKKLVFLSDRIKKGAEIQQTSQGTSFSSWENPQLMPKDMLELESEYGADVVAEALTKAHAANIKEAILRYDKRHDNVYALRTQLETISPEHVHEAEEALSAFETAQRELRQSVDRKDEELLEQGVGLKSEIQIHYNNLDDNINLGTNYNVEDVRRILNSDVFPPTYDFVSLKNSIDEQREKLEVFKTSVEEISKPDDVHNLVDKIGDLGTRYSFNPDYFKLEEREQQTIGAEDPAVRKIKNMRTYEDAVAYLDAQIKEFKKLKEGGMEKIQTAVEAQRIVAHLETALAEADIDVSVDELPIYFEKIENEREGAKQLLESIMMLERQLPSDEELDYHRGEIKVLSYDLRVEKIGEELSEVEREIEAVERKIRTYPFKPTLIGKRKWEEGRVALQEERENLISKQSKLRKEQHEIKSMPKYKIEVPDHSTIGRLVVLHSARGNKEEVFRELRAEAKKRSEQMVPGPVRALYRQYKAHDERLRDN